MRNELSSFVSLEAEKCQTGNGAETEILRWASLNGPDRARRIEATVQYMMEHLNQPMKVSTLSAMAGLSHSSFFAHFKSVTGWSPVNFFIRARMHLAAKLLEETCLQIKEIAALLGYDDRFYFSRVFKSVHGIAPREYRVPKEQSGSWNPKPRRPEKASEAYSPPCLPRLVQTG